MVKRVAIRLLSGWHGYRVGHVLPSVPAPAADVMVRQRRAEYVEETEPEVEVEPESEPVNEPAAVKKKRKRRKKNVDDTNIGDGNSASDGTTDTFGGEAATGDAASE